MAEEHEDLAGSAFELEYVTSAVGMGIGDGIVAHVVNDSGVAESVRVVIYKNTGAGAITVADTGRLTVTPTWAWSLSFGVTDPSGYWLRIQTTSESLVPTASFDRNEGGSWKPVAAYRPGDFAVFSLTRKRLW